MPFASIIALSAALLSAAVDPGSTSFPNADGRATVAPFLNGAPEPPASEVRIGDVAPDFSYEGFDGRWRNLHDLRVQGAVLLVIAPDRHQLTALESERASLIERGIVPVAILDATPRATASTIKKLGLRYSVIADPRRVIAEQFNAIQSRTHAAVPAWFVVDRSGTVRALDRGRFPQSGYLAVAAPALGLPAQGVALPSSRSSRR
jgi:peroxiredoxin